MSQCLQVERACLQQFEKALTVNDPQPCGQKGRALDDSVNTSSIGVFQFADVHYGLRLRNVSLTFCFAT